MGLLDRWVKKNQEKQLSGAKKNVESAVKSVAESDKNIFTKPTETVTAAAVVKVNGIAHAVLVRPLVTEKSAIMESMDKYSFLVARNANKQMVKQAVEELYGIKPIAVNIINVSGRRVRFGQNFGRRSDYRKAMVTLPKGKSIAIHEGV